SAVGRSQAANDPRLGAEGSAQRQQQQALGGADLGKNETQRHDVVAPALPGRWPAVVEHVPLMAAAAHAVVFIALDDDLVILFVREVVRNAGEEARPSGSAVVLHL